MLLPKTDGDRFLAAARGSSQCVRISAAFESLGASARAKTVFLLQPDNYESYALLGNFRPYLELLDASLEFAVQYRVFRNLVLDDSGKPVEADARVMQNVIFVGSDFYFAVEDNSFRKSRFLLFESVKQMCLHALSRPTYLDYMERVRRSCFGSPRTDGHPRPSAGFADCVQGAYESGVRGRDLALDEVRVTRTWGSASKRKAPWPRGCSTPTTGWRATTC